MTPATPPGTSVVPPGTPAVPPGLLVALDQDARRLDGGRVLLGGDPGRLVRLRPEGVGLFDGPAPAQPWGLGARMLARLLIEGGLAHPYPHPQPDRTPVRDLTVVVPVRDRTPELARCLAALGTTAPVLVVDDGSLEAERVAAVVAEYGAQLLRRPTCGGPAAARNAGLAATGTALVAFLDSDCVPPVGWLGALVGHFGDPTVGAVAPRVRSPVGPGVLARYARARGPLDMGARPSAVRPGGRVPYVPTAALVVRRTALSGAAPFDTALRYGEDVDLIWRLHDAGWRVRYDPRTCVQHDEPQRWWLWLGRRYRYGTSAAPLARLHGPRLAPLVLQPWPTAAWVLLLLGRPAPAVVSAAVPALRLHARLRKAGLPWSSCARVAMDASRRAVLSTGAGVGGAGSVLTGPLLLALLAPRLTRRASAAGLLAPPLLDLLARRPALDPGRWCAVRLADDLAYATGVWRGCWSARTWRPLRPRLIRPV